MSDQHSTMPPVSPERVVEILQRDPLGAALWRAASYQALAEAYEARVTQLERQHATPDGTAVDGG